MKRLLGVALRILVLVSCAGAQTEPYFERLHWHTDEKASGDRVHVKVPAIGVRPSNRWVRFAIDLDSREITLPGAEYEQSSTCRAVQNLDSGRLLWEDTWYFQTSAIGLRFTIDPDASIGVIGLHPDSDIWTQFEFVEFCPELGEVYFHLLPMTEERLVCRTSMGNAVRMRCPDTYSRCHVALTSGEEITTSIALVDAGRLPGSPVFPLQNGRDGLVFTLDGKMQLQTNAHLFAVGGRTAILSRALSDDKNAQVSTAALISGFLLLYTGFLIGGVQRVYMAAVQTLACYTLYCTLYIRKNLDVNYKVRYFLLPYGVSFAREEGVVLIITCIVPICAAMYLLIDAHISAHTTCVFRACARGTAVTLATLLPVFVVILIGMDKINVLLMALIGLFVATALLRDLTAPIWAYRCLSVHTAMWGAFFLVGMPICAWIYVLACFPLVSEVLLFATLPGTIASYAIVSHAALVMYHTWHENRGACD
jgi:hypothetical protein